ncbi:class I SAM-dependent methyltransferase [Lipingzhangella rawalii]|uniref:class I SAM-dependent methyltransferase n=1 Tax=Lipingzhangella rawalii TaxID=2055835 RepID=UPI0038992194
MSLDDLVAFSGHQLHVCRFREARTLLRWLGNDLRGQVVLDVAGGDGYWAGQARRRGARTVSVDLALHKLRRGRRLRSSPALVAGDALRLPLSDASVDAVLSVCALEHFPDGPAALTEMVRVLRPGGQLLLSADALTRRHRWPNLAQTHRRRYDVRRTYTHTQLRELLTSRGVVVGEHRYQFRGPGAELGYLAVSAWGGRLGFNAAAPAIPLVAASDAIRRNDRGSIVLLRARKPSETEGEPS